MSIGVQHGGDQGSAGQRGDSARGTAMKPLSPEGPGLREHGGTRP